MIDLIITPLRYDFFLRALLAVTIVGIVCPVLGSYIVLRGMTFLGDALAHIVLPGVVIAFLLGWPLLVGGLIMGILAALGIGALSQQSNLKEDTAVGVVLAGSFALGVALLSTTSGYASDLSHILFGNLLGVTPFDLVTMGILGAIVIAIIVLFYKEWLLISFDSVLATTLRLPTAFFNYLLYVLMAVTIVVSLQAVGVTLVLAMLVTPAATAMMLTRRLVNIMILGALIGLVSGIIGLYASYYWSIASGPSVVLTATLIFGVVFLLRRKQ